MSLTLAFQTDKSLAAYGPLAAQAEAYGFDGVSVYNDMLYQPAWPALMAMATATRRIRLGPAAVSPFLQHPIQIAGFAALLEESAPGRTYLGLARGAWLDFVGLRPRRPVSAVAEALAAIRHLLRGDPTPLPGVHFPLTGGDSLRWRLPAREIPFLLGSWGPQTIAAGRAWVAEIKLGGSANPAVAAWARQFLARDPGGANLAPPAVVLGAVTVVDEDGRAARNLARREVALYLPVVADLDPTVVIEPDRLAALRAAAGRYDFAAAAGLISDALLAHFAFAGTPDEVAGQALACLEAGAARVEFGTPHGLSPERGLRLLGERVLPAVRARG